MKTIEKEIAYYCRNCGNFYDEEGFLLEFSRNYIEFHYMIENLICNQCDEDFYREELEQKFDLFELLNENLKPN